MSNSRHHHSSSDTKSMKIWRSILSFLLFLSIAATSLTACIHFSFVSADSIVKMFTDREYVAALTDDVLAYAHDLCDNSSIPYDSVDSKIDYNSIYDIENAYISGALGTEEQFTETTYQDYIEGLKDELTELTDGMLAEYGIEAADGQENSAESFAGDIAEYIKQRVEFPFIEQLKAVVNIGVKASLAATLALALFGILIGLIVASIGKKTYQALRGIAYAFSAAGLLDLCLAAGVKIVGHFKSLVLHPMYFSDAVMKYVNNCLFSVCAAACMLFAAALIVIAIIWKLKRNAS